MLDSEFLRIDLNENIVGIHIRRTDYAVFRNGQYFYGDDIYIDKMKQMSEKIDCRFIIFTDDKNLDILKYKNFFPDIKQSDGTVVEDHYLMSKCDYIMGPPSTFSMWASYIGETPSLHIDSPDTIIDLEKFSICNG